MRSSHGEKIIGIFPTHDVANLRYFGILTIYPVLYSDYQYNQCRHGIQCGINRQNSKITPLCKINYMENSYNLLRTV